MGGGIDSVGARAEINAVEVAGQDLVFRIVMLDPQRQHHLLDLARHRALGRQEQVFRQLLGDGRAALHQMPRPPVDEQGAGDPDRVDAEMVVETLILGRDHCFGHIGWQLGDGNGGAVKIAIAREGRAIVR